MKPNNLKLTILVLFLLCPIPALAAHDHPEKYYQEQWCAKHGGEPFTLPDKTEVDCLTQTHAVEVDFAGFKIYEAIGQSLYYAMRTGKRAGILLIIEKESDRKYWLRMNETIKYYSLPIDAWQAGGE